MRILSYDEADQVTRIEERKSDGTMILLFSFQYDQAGRITEEFAGPLPKEYTPQTYTATYDADNRLATFNSNPVFHDSDGNMTVGPLLDDTLKTYSYNARNQLKSIAGTTYSYDAEGNRISSTVGSATTSFAIDPNTGLSKVLIRTKPGGEKTYYVYGMGLGYEVDESENTHSYHYDYRGSTRFMTDDSESVTDSAEYSPYGMVTHRTGNTDTPFLYNGAFGVMAEANGLYHMRARFYNPYTRRFVNPDPIGFSGGMNWYAYGNGNPVIYVDPEGTWVWHVVGAVAGGGLDLGVQLLQNGGDFGEVNWVSVGASTAAGALGVGLGANAARITTSIAGRAAINTIGSAGIGAGSQAATNIGTNIVENRSTFEGWDDNMLESAAVSGTFGGFGSVGGDVVERSINAATRPNAFLASLLRGGTLQPDSVPSLGSQTGAATGVILSNSGPVTNFFSPENQPSSSYGGFK